jgi:hypothetical protein
MASTEAHARRVRKVNAVHVRPVQKAKAHRVQKVSVLTVHAVTADAAVVRPAKAHALKAAHPAMVAVVTQAAANKHECD